MKAPNAQRGTSLPETVVVLAVLLALLFGIIEFGRAMYTYAFVAQIAREGARWAIVRGAQCTVLDHCGAISSDVQTYVQSLSEGATDPNQISVDAEWPPADCPAGVAAKSPGCVVVVTVKYPFKFMLPFMPSGNLATLSMSSTSQMVISQ